MLLEFIVSMFATLSFAFLFHSPKKQLVYCGLTGGFGWVVYQLCLRGGSSAAVANMIATFAMTLLARSIAALRRTPVTVYLTTGIFSLVPGAGIYYTSYYFIMDEMNLFAQAAANTLKTAGAIALGIAFAFSLPQNWFNALQKISRPRR